VTAPESRSARTVAPGVAAVALAVSALVALRLAGALPPGGTWFVAALVAGFSLSGSV
jgi:hypothetical protein